MARYGPSDRFQNVKGAPRMSDVPTSTGSAVAASAAGAGTLTNARTPQRGIFKASVLMSREAREEKENCFERHKECRGYGNS